MKLIAIIRERIFGKKTVADIISPLNKIKEELQSLIDAKSEETDRHVASIAELNAKIADNEADTKLAFKVRENVSKLLS